MIVTCKECGSVVHLLALDLGTIAECSKKQLCPSCLKVKGESR